MHHFFNPTTISECCALLAALFLLRARSGAWRLFILLLAITVLAELSGWASSYVFQQRGNGWIFNINLVISSILYIRLLSLAEALEQLKKLLQASIGFLLVFALLNGFFWQGFTAYQTYTDIVVELILILSCLYFFYSVLSAPDYKNLLKDEYFWLANSLLLYALGSVVLYAFYKNIVDFDKANGSHLYGLLNYVINVLLYSGLIISFVCRHKKTESSLG